MYQSDLKHPSKSLQDKLQTLYTLNREKTIDLSFRPPFLDLLKALGNPHLNLPPIIHVAGTNGKGSTIAMLRSIYETAGYKAHAYTSPHLIRFNERIVIAGQPIGNAALEELIDEALTLNEGRACTFFEITTAIAFAAFARNPADICLLEVGMGGRLDCTNVIEDPALTIITPIGLDHTEHLGDTIKAIAGEKAGIMKQSAPCVITPQRYAEATNTFEAIAKDKNINLLRPDTESLLDDEIGLSGQHQIQNAQTALKAIETLQNQFPLSKQHIKGGLKRAYWPARFQTLDAQGFGLPAEKTIILDGGHNKDAATTIAAQLKDMGGGVHLILCMMKHKDPAEFLTPLLPYLNALTLTQIPNEPASLSAEDLETALQDICADVPVTNAPTYQDALKSSPADTILIAGSLYLAGHVLQDVENQGHT